MIREGAWDGDRKTIRNNWKQNNIKMVLVIKERFQEERTSTSKPSVFSFVFFCIRKSLSLPPSFSFFRFLYPKFTLCHSLILLWKRAIESWVFKVFWCFNLNIWTLLTEFCIFCPPVGTLNISPSHFPLEIYTIKLNNANDLL